MAVPALAEAVEALGRAAVGNPAKLGSILAGMLNDDGEDGALEKVDDRLFALRNAARRFGVDLSALTALRDDFRARLNVVDDGGATLANLARDAAEAKTAYEKTAALLTAARVKAAKNFDKAIATELAAAETGQGTD